MFDLTLICYFGAILVGCFLTGVEFSKMTQASRKPLRTSQRTSRYFSSQRIAGEAT
jgi:hypothetical protein